MITDYISYQRDVKNLSERTLEEYSKNLHAFAAWMRAARPGSCWSKVSRADIDAHTAAMAREGLMPRTIQLRVASIRAFYNWMMQQGLLAQNPARYCQSPRAGMQLPQVVSVEAITSYLTQPALTRRTVEIQALTALLAETGIRLQEALDITRKDVDRQAHSILIHGKGNKQRIVYYGDLTADRMNRLAALTRNAPRFFTFDQRTYRVMMSQEFRPFCPYIHPHMLRHTYASRALAAGVNLKTVSSMLGHASARTTEIYTHVFDSQLQQASRLMHLAS